MIVRAWKINPKMARWMDIPIHPYSISRQIITYASSGAKKNSTNNSTEKTREDTNVSLYLSNWSYAYHPHFILNLPALYFIIKREARMEVYQAIIGLTTYGVGVGHKVIIEEIYNDENLGILLTDASNNNYSFERNVRTIERQEQIRKILKN